MIIDEMTDGEFNDRMKHFRVIRAKLRITPGPELFCEYTRNSHLLKLEAADGLQFHAVQDTQHFRLYEFENELRRVGANAGPQLADDVVDPFL